MAPLRPDARLCEIQRLLPIRNAIASGLRRESTSGGGIPSPATPKSSQNFSEILTALIPEDVKTTFIRILGHSSWLAGLVVIRIALEQIRLSFSTC
jgi:hypothetical protein